MGQGRNHEFIIHLIIFFTSLRSLYIVRASVLKLTHSLDQEPELYYYTRVCQLSHYYLENGEEGELPENNLYRKYHILQ